MGNTFNAYPLGAFIDGAKSVLGQIFMIWASVIIGSTLGALAAIGFAYLGYLEYLGIPILFSGLMFFAIYVTNFCSVWGFVANTILLVLVPYYWRTEQFKCESFFGICLIVTLSTFFRLSDISMNSLLRLAGAIFLLAAIYGGIRLLWWRRLRQLDKCTAADFHDPEEEEKEERF